MNIQEKTHEQFQAIFQDLKNHGKLSAPRGQRVLELEHYTYRLDPYVRFCSLPSRKLKLDYIKHEFLWYLKGDRFDLSILEKAKMWGTLIDSDGGINSNYGQYIFFTQPGERCSQYDNVLQLLRKDRDTRRASIVILRREHLLNAQSNDYPCTYVLNFRIRDNKLNMSVHMRSQDAVFGMANDAPAFSFIQEMIMMEMRKTNYPVDLGYYHHTADSFHIYERHFEMLEQLITDPHAETVDCPMMTADDPWMLRNMHDKNVVKPAGIVGEEWAQFSNWLTDGKFEKAYDEHSSI